MPESNNDSLVALDAYIRALETECSTLEMYIAEMESARERLEAVAPPISTTLHTEAERAPRKRFEQAKAELRAAMGKFVERLRVLRPD